MAEEKKPVGRLMLKNVRIAFARGVFRAESVQGGEPRYGANFLLPRDHPQVKEIESTMKAVAKAKWGDKAGETYSMLAKKDRLALHDGDLKSNYDGFAGNLFVAAASKQSVRPTVVDSDGRTQLVETDGRPYSGCYVNASLEFWAQGKESGFGERINCQLRGVQFVRDGESFGGGGAASVNEFSDETGGRADAAADLLGGSFDDDATF